MWGDIFYFSKNFCYHTWHTKNFIGMAPCVIFKIFIFKKIFFIFYTFFYIYDMCVFFMLRELVSSHTHIYFIICFIELPEILYIYHWLFIIEKALFIILSPHVHFILHIKYNMVKYYMYSFFFFYFSLRGVYFFMTMLILL